MNRITHWLILTALFCLPSMAATYHVDFANGSDSQTGTMAAPWKHAPGDANASGVPASISLQPGDVVLFRGGVVYRGSVTVQRSGSLANPIVFKGNGWGSEIAIIDGSEEIVAPWTRCASAAECNGNPNWGNIWYADLPAVESAYTANLHEGNEFCYVAQSPSPPDPYYPDNVTNYHVPAAISSSSLVHAGLGDFGGMSLVGKHVLVYESDNVVRHYPILSFNPALSSITYPQTENPPYTDDLRRFALANDVKFIDSPGEYAYEEGGNHRTYYWPRSGNPADAHLTISMRRNAFYLNECSYIHIEGFWLQKFSGRLGHDGAAIVGAGSSEHPCQGLLIRNNRVEHNRFGAYGGHGGIFLTFAHGSVITDNLVQWNPRHRGIFASSSERITISDNTVIRAGLTAISFYGCRLSRVVDNRILDCRGGHGNGMSFYLGCERILVAHNEVYDANIVLTAQASSAITLFGNYFNGANHTNLVVTSWENVNGFNVVANTIVGSSAHFALRFNDDTQNGVSINNILDGASGPGYRSHNAYVGLAWPQAVRYGWSPASGELVRSVAGEYAPLDPAAVFLAPGQENFHLKAASPAIDAGVDPTAYLPKADFPDFDFQLDPDRLSRPQGQAWDMGAYEYVSGLALISPNGTEIWRKGEQRQISWNANGVTGDLVIELLQNGSVVGVITSSVPASAGSFTWIVGRLQNGSFVTGNNLKIRIKTITGTTVPYDIR